MDERAAGVGVAQRVEALGQAAHVGARLQAEAAEHPPDGAPDGARDRAEQEGQHELGARQRRRAEHEADLLAEAAAVDEHQPLERSGNW